jgi:hypothetical protein
MQRTFTVASLNFRHQPETDIACCLTGVQRVRSVGRSCQVRGLGSYPVIEPPT